MEELARYYELVTGNNYAGESEAVISERVNEVQSFLKDEAHLLNFRGPIATIHTTLDPYVIRSIDIDFQQTYCKIMGVSYQGADQIFRLKMENLEMERYYAWVNTILFSEVRREYPGKLTIYTPLSPDEVVVRGPRFYYLQRGAITLEGLVEIHSQYQLILIAAFLARIAHREFIPKPLSMTELAKIIIDLAETCVMDPRTFLTISGPLIRHTDEYVDLNEFEPDRLKELLEYQGLSTIGMDYRTMYHRYVFTQLLPSFWPALPTGRRLIESVRNTSTTMPDEIIQDVDAPLFWGENDGVSRYWMFSLRELETTFTSENRPLNPRTGIDFSIRDLRRIQFLHPRAPVSRWISQYLNTRAARTTPNTITGVSDTTMISDRQVSTIIIPKEELIVMQNIGLSLADYAEEFAPYEGNHWHLSQVDMLPYTIDVRSHRRDLLNMLLRLQEIARRYDIWMVHIRNPVSGGSYFIDTSDPFNTLEGALIALRKCVDLGLIDTLIYYGEVLVTTSEYYMTMGHGTSACTNLMFFEYGEDEPQMF